MSTTLSFDATGTIWEITLNSNYDENKLTLLIKNLVEQFESHYSRFRENSTVTEIAHKSGDIALPDNAKLLFDIYRDLENLTEGIFTPLIGKTLTEAGYDKEYSFNTKPLTTNLRWDDVFDYNFPKIKVKTPVQLDFGAAGKGYLMDLIANLLTQNGINSFIIDAGHDYLISKSGNPIKIGLENPHNASSVIGVIQVDSGSICGSAGNRRKWSKYNHIINGKTLESSKDILATWVIAKTGIIADALSTALFLIEPEILNRKYSFEYVILNADFSVKVSDNFSGELFNE